MFGPTNEDDNNNAVVQKLNTIIEILNGDKNARLEVILAMILYPYSVYNTSRREVDLEVK
jgi:hypothetical protein